jgi:hypothetical protein
MTWSHGQGSAAARALLSPFCYTAVQADAPVSHSHTPGLPLGVAVAFIACLPNGSLARCNNQGQGTLPMAAVSKRELCCVFEPASWDISGCLHDDPAADSQRQ